MELNPGFYQNSSQISIRSNPYPALAMGGGGAMRAAAKVAGIGLFNGGIRSAGAEKPVSIAARAAVARPSSSVAEGGVVAFQDQQEAKARKSILDDEWDLAAGEDFCVVAGGNSSTAPRLVFGPVPTLEEAKEATSELKEAIDKMYFSLPETAGSANSIPAAEGLGFVTDAQAQLEHMEDKTLVTIERPVIPSMPKRAIEAFKLLKENPAAQMVVASIACDPNVWNAVLQNDALQGYLLSGTADYAGYDEQQTPRSYTDSSTVEDGGNTAYGFSDFVEDIKNRVLDMVNNVTDFIQNLFGDSKSAFGFMEANQGSFIGGSFMALAVMVIMVVLVRRA
ncbi:hypothetical protein Dimus_012579 [Dionaea muscipula]